MRIVCAELPSGFQYRIPDCGRSSALNSKTPQAELSLTDAVHQFDAGDRDHRVAELLEPQHYSNALLDAAVVLLNQVIEVFRRNAVRRLSGREPSAFRGSRTARSDDSAVQRDRLWWRLNADSRQLCKRQGWRQRHRAWRSSRNSIVPARRVHGTT